MTYHNLYLLRSIKNFRYKDFEKQKYKVYNNFYKVYPDLWSELNSDKKENILLSLYNTVKYNNYINLDKRIQYHLSYLLTKEMIEIA